jgi:hypothetical protein
MPIGAKDNVTFGARGLRWRLATGVNRLRRVSIIAGAPRAPYSLAPTVFPLPSLAAMAGRAALGGPREVALACFLVGRLVIDLADGGSITEEQRKTRALGARHWLGSAAIPPVVRSALTRLAEATAAAEPSDMREALESVMTVTANHLDPGSLLELGRLAQAIAG